MKKRIICILLTAVMLLTLIPITAFAADYTITNGTPESAKETNHGFIAIDKATAAKGDTVTITVNPADGYQLKSLTVTPAFTVTFDLNGITGTAPTAQKIKDGEKVTKPADPTDTVHTFAGWYKTKDATTGALSDPWDFDNDTVTANMTLYAQWTRTMKVLLGNDFPKSQTNSAPEKAWTNANGYKAFIYGSDKYFKLDPGNANGLACLTSNQFTRISDDKYVFEYVNGSNSYGVFTLNIEDSTLVSIEYDGTGTSYEWLSGTYSPVSQCIAAGTMISMPEGNQKAVEELEIGDVINTFDHETGEVSSAPVCFIWGSKNTGNAFTLTFEDDVEVTVIEEHGFYDQEEQKYVFINLQNAEEYIGDHFYNADTNSWLALKNCEALNESIDAYAIITSGDLNHMSNGMLSMCDGTVKVLANIFEYDNQMKFDADKKKADIEAYGLTSKEKILELEGFIESDYDDYNLQYLNVAIGKGLTTWEWIEAFSDYCVENGLVDIYSGSETAEKNEAPKMLLTSATAPKTLLGSTPELTPQDGIEIKANENGTYQFTMPGYAVTVTAEFEATPEPDPINYKIIEGANSVWVIAANEDPVFRSNADFSKFSHVLLDGKELAKKYYKAESGSTIITLTPEYAATLAVGKHTIEIVSTDGSASTVFYIEETIANTDGEGFALSTATMSSAFIGCNIVGLAVVFFELKKKKKVR
ncbi:MAG: InlB B-repeat-containing protein [Oscillospiraceae bacterium]|nr:InlB B-repeat-containing protein [Candidatus Limimonas egerieequi]